MSRDIYILGQAINSKSLLFQKKKVSELSWSSHSMAVGLSFNFLKCDFMTSITNRLNANIFQYC